MLSSLWSISFRPSGWKLQEKTEYAICPTWTGWRTGAFGKMHQRPHYESVNHGNRARSASRCEERGVRTTRRHFPDGARYDAYFAACVAGHGSERYAKKNTAIHFIRMGTVNSCLIWKRIKMKKLILQINRSIKVSKTI